MKRVIMITFGLLLMLALIGCEPVALLVGGGAAVTYKAAIDERSIGEMWSDTAISARVKSSLAKDDGVHARQVDVDTIDGEVLLTGVVDTDDQSERAESIAKRVPGVRNVRNELQVGEKTLGQSLDDTLLATRIKTHLFKEPWVRSFNIDVDVNRGVVTMTGIMNKADLKGRVLEIANATPGVVRVIDNIKVR